MMKLFGTKSLKLLPLVIAASVAQVAMADSSTEINSNMNMSLDDEGKLTVNSRYLTYYLMRAENPTNKSVGTVEIIKPSDKWLDFSETVDIDFDGFIPKGVDFSMQILNDSKTDVYLSNQTNIDWKETDISLRGASIVELFSSTNDSEKVAQDRAVALLLNVMRGFDITVDVLADTDAMYKTSLQSDDKNKAVELYQKLQQLSQLSQKPAQYANDIAIVYAMALSTMEEYEKYAEAVGESGDSLISDPKFRANYKNAKLVVEAIKQSASIMRVLDMDKVYQEKQKIDEQVARQALKIDPAEVITRDALSKGYQTYIKQTKLQYSKLSTNEEKAALFRRNLASNLHKAIAQYKKNTGKPSATLDIVQGLIFIHTLIHDSTMTYDGKRIDQLMGDDPEASLMIMTKMFGAVSWSITKGVTKNTIKDFTDNTYIDVANLSVGRLKNIEDSGAILNNISSKADNASSVLKAFTVGKKIGNRLIPYLWDFVLGESMLKSSISNGVIKTYPRAKVTMRVFDVANDGKLTLLNTFVNEDGNIEVNPGSKIAVGVWVERPRIFSDYSPWKKNSSIYSSVLQQATISEVGDTYSSASTAVCVRKVFKNTDFSVHKVGMQNLDMTRINGDLNEACGVGTMFGKPWYENSINENEVTQQFRLTDDLGPAFTKFIHVVPSNTSDIQPLLVKVNGYDFDFHNYRITINNLVHDFEFTARLDTNNKTNEGYYTEIESEAFTNAKYDKMTDTWYVSMVSYTVTGEETKEYKVLRDSATGKYYTYLPKIVEPYRLKLINRPNNNQVIASAEKTFEVESFLSKVTSVTATPEILTINQPFTLEVRGSNLPIRYELNILGCDGNKIKAESTSSYQKYLCKPNISGDTYSVIGFSQDGSRQLFSKTFQVENKFGLGFDLADSIEVNKQFTFDVNQSKNDDTCIVKANYNWGDGSQPTVMNADAGKCLKFLPAAHTYANAGTYTISGSWVSGNGDSLNYHHSLVVEDSTIVNQPKLTKTGVSFCATEEETLLTCTLQKLGSSVFGLNQDGELQAGIPMNYERLLNNGDECIKDKATGLIWEQKTNNGGLRDFNHTYDWFNPDNRLNGGDEGSKHGGCNDVLPLCNTDAYIKEINRLNYCGYSDWRLPTYSELLSIVDYGEIDFENQKPAINTKYFYFPNYSQGNYRDHDIYWTSTSSSKSKYSAISIDFRNGETPDSNDNKSQSKGIRLVRSN